MCMLKTCKCPQLPNLNAALNIIYIYTHIMDSTWKCGISEILYYTAPRNRGTVVQNFAY